MKAYKVVRREGKKLVSCIIEDQDWKMTYPMGKWVSPRKRNSRLFCFKNIKAAYNFIREGSFEIWEAEIKVSKLKPKYVPFSGLKSYFEDYWNAISRRMNVLKVIPKEFLWAELDDVILANRVKLIRRVY
jgi:hypothetical protein